MKIEVNIEAQLEELWQRIGLEGDQIEEQYQDLNKRVQDLFRAFLKENVKKVQDLTKEAQEAEEAVRLHIHRFSLDDEDDVDEDAPLLVRIENAKERLAILQEETKAQEEEFMAAFTELTICFDTLEIDDRGEFGDEGDDFGWERIDRMIEKTKELKNEIAERRPRMEDLLSEIDELRHYLGLEEYEYNDTLGDDTFTSVENQRDHLSQKLEENREEAVKLIKAIRWIEKALRMKHAATDNIKIFSDENVEKLRTKFKRLEKEKMDHIPELIEAMKKDLMSLWTDLHMPVPSAVEFPFIYSCPATKRTLVALESEVLRLENMKQNIEPMLDLIAAREEILAQFNKLNAFSEDPSRLTSRRSRAASMLIEEERIRKRYKVELPKIHAKLIPQLQDYEETYGEPFMWDGEELLTIVSEMHKKETATLGQTKTRQSTMRKTSVSRNQKTQNSLAQRPPFQIQEFMF